MAYVDSSADFVSYTIFTADTGRRSIPVDETINTGFVVAAFCNPHVNTSARFTAEDADLTGDDPNEVGLTTRSNRYSVDDYVVVNGGLFSVEEYPETFRVTLGVAGWDLVSMPRITDPAELRINCTSRWIPKVGKRAMYEAGVWRPYAGSEPLNMYAVSPGDPQTPKGSASLFPVLLDNGTFTYIDATSGERVEADAIQFTGDAKLSTNTPQWASGHVAAMMVVVPSNPGSPIAPTHLIGFAPNERARSAGFTVSIDANSQIQLWSDDTEAATFDDFRDKNKLATINIRGNVGVTLNTPMIVGLRYNANTDVATLFVSSQFLGPVAQSAPWTIWKDVPPAERLASCDLQLLYSPMENQVEVLDVSLWLGELDDETFRRAAEEYMQCYGATL